jgi:hypothetical protein
MVWTDQQGACIKIMFRLIKIFKGFVGTPFLAFTRRTIRLQADTQKLVPTSRL